jgi:hypothetical protein
MMVHPTPRVLAQSELQLISPGDVVTRPVTRPLPGPPKKPRLRLGAGGQWHDGRESRHDGKAPSQHRRLQWKPVCSEYSKSAFHGLPSRKWLYFRHGDGGYSDLEKPRLAPCAATRSRSRALNTRSAGSSASTPKSLYRKLSLPQNGLQVYGMALMPNGRGRDEDCSSIAVASVIKRPAPDRDK